MTAMLAAHLRAGASRPFEWGETDCSLFACDWIKAVTGVDPASAFRGRYTTARGAARHSARGGGFLAVTARCMAASGLSEVADPKPGDVGMVETTLGPTLAIMANSGWAAKGLNGIVISRNFPLLMAWSVPCLPS